jgi:hypothetical protein
MEIESITAKNWFFISKDADGKLYITMAMKRVGRVDFGESLLNIIPENTPFSEGFTDHIDFITDKPIIADREFLQNYLDNAADNIMALSRQIFRRLFSDFKYGMVKMEARTADDYEPGTIEGCDHCGK